jgi:hypothetical protein
MFSGFYLNSHSGVTHLNLKSKTYLAIFVFSLITVPICSAHTDSAPWEPTQPTSIGTAQVKPGNYQLKAYEGEDELQVAQDGNVFSTTLCYWVPLPNKAAVTEVKVTNNKVVEVQFKGRSEAILFFPPQ